MGKFLNEKQGPLLRWGNFPVSPPGRSSPSELYSRHICISAVFFPIKQSCHCFNCFPEASVLQRSVLQPDASKGRDVPAHRQIQAPPPLQLIIPRRGRSDRSRRRYRCRQPASPFQCSCPSSPLPELLHHASTCKTLCFFPRKPTSSPYRNPPPQPLPSAVPPSHTPTHAHPPSFLFNFFFRSAV